MDVILWENKLLNLKKVACKSSSNQALQFFMTVSFVDRNIDCMNLTLVR